eukprot:TRINITY_DN17890_c0_g3_i2.p6 TRINITY_DN17890_c0_g3~~TRINITY_DN17890_c0_g3_i2.p6  ORF type:complete len:105 (-),score=7.13 TRINITY_DN17890_c0_g3_i2:279-593(-)
MRNHLNDFRVGLVESLCDILTLCLLFFGRLGSKIVMSNQFYKANAEKRMCVVMGGQFVREIVVNGFAFQIFFCTLTRLFPLSKKITCYYGLRAYEILSLDCGCI